MSAEDGVAGRRGSRKAGQCRRYAAIVELARISVDHQIMGGVPCVRGTRIPVATVLGMLADGASVQEILADFPQLAEEDVRAVLRYAAAAVDERELPVRLGA